MKNYWLKKHSDRTDGLGRFYVCCGCCGKIVPFVCLDCGEKGFPYEALLQNQR